MGLIHWWPLNGNLNDIGIGGTALYGEGGFSYSNNGKIGKCGDFTDTTAYCSQTMNALDISGKTTLSFCGWYKIPTISNARHLFEFWTSSSSRFLVEVLSSGRLSTWNGSGSVLASDDYIQANTWLHFAMVVNNGTASFYVNGIKQSSTTSFAGYTSTFYLCTGGSGTSTYNFTGYANDVRIYDHALSAKEVKEISKGLVLHYDFNDPYVEGTTNLITGIAWTDNCTIEGNGVRVAWNVSAADTYLFFNTSEGMIDGQTYTFSFDVVGLHEENVVFAWSNINSEPYLVTLKNGRNSITFPGTSSELRTFFDDIYRNTVSNFWMGNFQLEKKDHATPYVNGTRQPGLVYDCSGYGYSGEQFGDIQVLEGSQSGKYCLLNNATSIDSVSSTGSAYIKGDLKTSYAPENITISFWAKITNFGVQDSGILSLSSDSSTPADYLDSGVNQYDWVFRFNLSSSDATPGTDNYIDLNNWHYYALVYNGTSVSKYRDGVLIGTSSGSGSLKPFRYIYLGLSTAGGAWRKTRAYWGDFKIFSTPLSEADILAEYNRKASIDKTGNFFTGELVEGDASNIKVTKAAITKGNHFVEGTDVAKFVDGYIELEYLQSDGNQYIDTGFIPNQDTGAEIKFAADDYSNDKAFFYGSGISSGNRAFELFPWNSQLEFNYGNQYPFLGSTPANGTIITAYQHKNSYGFKVEGGNTYTSTHIQETFNCPYTMALFALHRSSSSYYLSSTNVRIYKCIIYDNGAPVRNFIPAKRKSDNALGLYDLANRKFYTNAGTGSFVAGPEVSGVSAIYAKEFKEN